MKKEEKTEITKAKIIKAALEEFGQNGFANAAINNLCKKNNIAKGLVYHNYANKEALYLCCAEYAVNKFITYMNQNFSGDDLHSYMKQRYRFFDENQNLSRLIFEIILQPSTILNERIVELKSTFDEYNLSLYKSAMKKIKLRDGISEEDAVQYYNMLQNMLNGCLSRNDLDADSFAAAFLQHEEHLKKIIDYMLYGIAEK